MRSEHRRSDSSGIDPAISLWYRARLGDPVEAGQELARFYVQPGDEGLAGALAACFQVEAEAASPPLVHRVVRSHPPV